MQIKFRHHIAIFLVACATFLTAIGCANRGSGPQGGPKDITPPRVAKSSPENNSLNIKSPIVEISFDEIVQLESPFEKVIISPPQSTPAEIKALGHKIKVELKDTLKENTTYTIDFTDAIKDNNEGNKLDGYSFGFSTGDYIDSLRVRGTVLDAETLDPVAGIMVGIHSELHDSALTSQPFLRISRTNAEGRFTVSNIAEGKYRVYALADMGNNFKFDLPTERIAFLDSVYTPVAEVITAYDTIGSYYTDSLTGAVDSAQFVIDTIIARHSTKFTPDDILMLSFVEKDSRFYLTRNERPERHRFSLIFSSRCDTLPKIRPLNIPDSSFTYMLQRSQTVDTLTYWLTDTVASQQDTLACEVQYYRIDLDTQYVRTDTLRLIYRQPKGKATNAKNIGKQKPSQPQVKKILSHNGSTKFDIYQPLTLTLTTPSTVNDTCRYQLQQKKDTVYYDIGATLVPSDSIGLQYRIDYKWKPETSYRLLLDSAYFIALDSTVSQKEEIQFTIKSLEEYGKIIFTILNYRGNEVIQLLNKSGNTVREIRTTQATTVFEYITPDIYYARLFIDSNGNGEWDTGSYAEHRQPEEVYYFPYEIEVRAFWDVEEEWDIHELPLPEQKPKALRKDTKTK